MGPRGETQPRFTTLPDGKALAYWSAGGERDGANDRPDRGPDTHAPHAPADHPLVCLHGGMGLDSHYLRAGGLLSLASPERRVLVFDQAGHGLSDPEPDHRYSNARWTDDLGAFATTLGLDRFDLFGHSYGGFLALDFALEHPRRVRRLILNGTSAGPVSVDLRPRTIECNGDLERIFTSLWPTFFPGRDTHEQILRGIRYSHEPFRDAFENELPRFDRRARLGELPMPVLLCCGAHDRYIEPMRAMLPAIANARLVEYPRSGHMPFLDDPVTFRESILNFLFEKEVER